MAPAPRDDNSIPTLLAVSNADGVTPVVLWADPTTHRLLVSATMGSLNDLSDVTLTGAAQGDILYRNATAWVNLAAGDSGKYLKTQGAGANPIWDSPSTAVPTQITVANEATDTSCFPLFVTAATGDLGPKTVAGLSFNSNTAVLTATGFSGPLTGNVTGNCSGTAATVTEAAQSAITSLGTLTALDVDNININGNTISSTAGTDLLITPLAGQQLILDGHWQFDGSVLTAITDNDTTITAYAGKVIDIEGVKFDGGSITEGAWAGTVITTAKGGTGVANGANNTITFTGNYTLGLTLSDNTSVTLPTSGTLATVTGTGDAITVGTIELGNASDTTLSRSAAGVLAVESVVIPSISSTNTLTNKRVTPRVGTTTSSATPTINTDNYDAYSITAQEEAITSFTTNLSGTPTNFQKLLIRIKDNGTARAITWGASFEDGSQALPTTTVVGKTLLVGLIYDSVDSKWACEATGSRA
jgi:hypothetical protein